MKTNSYFSRLASSTGGPLLMPARPVFRPLPGENTDFLPAGFESPSAASDAGHGIATSAAQIARPSIAQYTPARSATTIALHPVTSTKTAYRPETNNSNARPANQPKTDGLRSVSKSQIASPTPDQPRQPVSKTDTDSKSSASTRSFQVQPSATASVSSSSPSFLAKPPVELQPASRAINSDQIRPQKLSAAEAAALAMAVEPHGPKSTESTVRLKPAEWKRGAEAVRSSNRSDEEQRASRSVLEPRPSTGVSNEPRSSLRDASQPGTSGSSVRIGSLHVRINTPPAPVQIEPPRIGKARSIPGANRPLGLARGFGSFGLVQG